MEANGLERLFLTVPELASHLRIGRNKAYEMCRRGQIPAVRLGRTIRVPLGGLLKLANQQ